MVYAGQLRARAIEFLNLLYGFLNAPCARLRDHRGSEYAVDAQ